MVIRMRRLKLSLMGLVMTALAVNAQDKTAVKYANTITPEDMRAKLSILASDEFGGRETGTEGQKKASRFFGAETELTKFDKSQEK